MEDKQQDKIIQIISAPGDLRANVTTDCGYGKDLKVVCLALDESGRVWPMVIMGGTFCWADRPYI